MLELCCALLCEVARPVVLAANTLFSLTQITSSQVIVLLEARLLVLTSGKEDSTTQNRRNMRGLSLSNQAAC
jgi:hypothetical protein